MSGPSIIFFLVFVIPLVIFLLWLVKQDKKKGTIGLIIVAITVVVAIVYMFVKTGGH